jgi:hypothetical protein
LLATPVEDQPEANPVDPQEFKGELFGQIDHYRNGLLDDTEELRLRMVHTLEFGSLVTGDVIAAGRRVVRSIDVRNQTPIFPELFLNFLKNRQWIAPTDDALVRMKRALKGTPSVYRKFISAAAVQPMAGLFELNVFDLLSRAFPGAEPQPKLTGSSKRSDVRIVVDGATVYVEATVLTEGDFWGGVASMMQEQGLSVYTTAGPGPDIEARRIVAKVERELSQAAPDAPNIIAISFFGTFPSDMAREWAFSDLLAGGGRSTQNKDGTKADLTNLAYVDSILEFGRARLLKTHVNPRCDAAFRLPDATRERICRALEENEMMIR